MNTAIQTVDILRIQFRTNQTLLFVGPHCEIQWNPCASSPCHNGVCRSIGMTRFKCECYQYFIGETCEIEVDSCAAHVCVHGTCIERDHQAVCDCWPGYTGGRCDVEQDNCVNNPCDNGECISSLSGFMCKCAAGFIGRRCHLRSCDYMPCHLNARCINLPVAEATRQSYRCVCAKGLQGAACTQIKSPCQPNPCNNGTCKAHTLRTPDETNASATIDEDVYEKYECKCAPHFFGQNCDIFVEPDFALEFTKPGVHNYVRLNGFASDLEQVS